MFNKRQAWNNFQCTETYTKWPSVFNENLIIEFKTKWMDLLAN